MRLSRNRGNARGPTRLTNPLRLRAMSCSARLSVLPPNPPLRYSLLFLFPLPRLPEGTPFFLSFSLALFLSLSWTFRHSTHILPLCRLLAYLPASLSSPSSSIHPSLPPFARSTHSFRLSLFHNPPTTVFIFRYSLVSPLSSSVISPMSTSLRSSISSPCSHRRSARYILLPLPCLLRRHRRLVVFFFFFFACEPCPPSPVGIFLPSLLPNYRKKIYFFPLSHEILSEIDRIR